MSSDNNTHERYEVSDPSILLEDTWAEPSEDLGLCERCGAPLVPHRFRCTACGMPIAMCMGSCSVCVSPRCVGGKRKH